MKANRLGDGMLTIILTYLFGLMIMIKVTGFQLEATKTLKKDMDKLRKNMTNLNQN